MSFLIVGLGNPGQEYQNNRHNIGFRIVDFLIHALGATKQNHKFLGELYKRESLLFLKPVTFMNHSGLCVQQVLQFYKITDFLVLHDDLDLPFGAVKFKFGGGSGGHNGLKSIDTQCTNAYYRIRYGIGKPTNKEQIVSWVLNDFSKDEEAQNIVLIPHCAKVALEIAKLESHNQLATKIASLYTLNPKTPGVKDSHCKTLLKQQNASVLPLY